MIEYQSYKNLKYILINVTDFTSIKSSFRENTLNLIQSAIKGYSPRPKIKLTTVMASS